VAFVGHAVLALGSDIPSGRLDDLVVNGLGDHVTAGMHSNPA
jgi:hypothetical protein